MSVGLSVEAITQECFYEGSRSSNITYSYENIIRKVRLWKLCDQGQGHNFFSIY